MNEEFVEFLELEVVHAMIVLLLSFTFRCGIGSLLRRLSIDAESLLDGSPSNRVVEVFDVAESIENRRRRNLR